MTKKHLIRKEKCSGCCYSPTPVAHDAKEGRADIKADPNRVFFCHQYDITSPVVCKGFYDAHPDRIKGEVALVRYKGEMHDIWKDVKPGGGFFRGNV